MPGSTGRIPPPADDLCASTNRAKARLSGQNGKVDDFKPLVRAKCGKRHKRAHRHHRQARHRGSVR